MINKNQELGQTGEDLAVEYLCGNGYTILETNWRSGSLEVDIIAETNDEIIFVEVKTRSNILLTTPQFAVNKAKQRNIVKAANMYVIKKDVKKDARFDIIAIVKNNNLQEIEHIPNAFYAMRN